MTHPLISIVTVVKNDPPGFDRTARCICAMNRPVPEWIVIDGGSSDGTTAVILEYADHIAWWVSEPDGGPYEAMNKGLARATGEWVIFLNAGDVFAGPGVLSQILDSATESDDVIYGDSIADYGKFRILRKAGAPGGLNRAMVFSHQAMLVRTALARQAGFNTAYRIGADFDMVRRLYEAGKKFVYFAGPVAVFAVQGISHRYMDRAAGEHYRICSAYRSPSAAEKLHHFLYMGFLKMITFAYRLLPATAMLAVVRLVNRRTLVRNEEYLCK